MREDDVSKLQRENSRLLKLATHDELTGILNRRATETVISENLERGGAILVCDLDHFKTINDRYGHLMGDNCLKKTAELLNYIIRPTDILGRIGGDEFVIFAYGMNGEAGIKALCNRIEERFLSYSENEAVRISITAAGAMVEPGDTYETAFERADKALLQKKELKHTGRSIESESEECDNWSKDVSQIHDELIEQISGYGAFCQDYEAFKVIYRFMERGMRRNKQKACVILLSLTEPEDGESEPQILLQEMEELGEIIQKTLRLGDVYTRYSSCQYLVLLTDITENLAENVAQRVRRMFAECTSSRSVLMHYCYELKAAEYPSNPE